MEMNEGKTYRVEVAGTTHLTFERGHLNPFGVVVGIVNYQDLDLPINDKSSNHSDEIHVFVRKNNGETDRIVFHASNPYLIVFRRYKKGTKE